MKQLLTLVLAAVMLCSCTAAEPEETDGRNYVDISRKETWYSMEYFETDSSLIENIIPAATQILMVRADTVNDLLYTGSYHFEYG